MPRPRQPAPALPRWLWPGLAVTASALVDRVPVPGGRGCNVIPDRAACCLFRDGRLFTDYSGQDCVPAREGMSFAVEGSEGVMCQPACWALGTCGDGGNQAQRIGACGASSPTSWYLLGSNRACRADYNDTTTDGRGTVIVKEAGADLARCKDLCAQTPSCNGVEFSPAHRHCELWTRPIGFTLMSPGFECWGFTAPAPAPLPGVVEQAGARIAAGGDLRFYAIGTSNAAWQTWPDQLHAMLDRLGYNVNMQDLAIPGAMSRPSKAPICADASTYASLHTPRLGMIGWSSWGFAYDSKADCDAEGFRHIAGFPVSCTNAWACNPNWQGQVPSVNATALAHAVRDAHFVVLANWINDAKAAQQSGPREACYKGADIDAMKTTDITAASLKRLIRAIHAQNPDVKVLVLARYPDTRQIVYPRESTLPVVNALNAAVEEKIKGEPNTFFVNFSFPLGENMFQWLSKVHPNCRGDKVMATRVVEALFTHKIVSRGLALGIPEQCLGSSACGTMSLSCCQRSALCFVAADGRCTPYGPGVQ